METDNINLTTYDKLLRAWENSMEMVRDFEMHSKNIKEEEVKQVFKKFAEEEGVHAAEFRKLILKYENNRKNEESTKH